VGRVPTTSRRRAGPGGADRSNATAHWEAPGGLRRRIPAQRGDGRARRRRVPRVHLRRVGRGQPHRAPRRDSGHARSQSPRRPAGQTMTAEHGRRTPWGSAPTPRRSSGRGRCSGVAPPAPECWITARQNAWSQGGAEVRQEVAHEDAPPQVRRGGSLTWSCPLRAHEPGRRGRRRCPSGRTRRNQRFGIRVPAGLAPSGARSRWSPLDPSRPHHAAGATSADVRAGRSVN